MKNFSLILASAALVAVLMPQQLTAQTDPSIGTWKLNVAKSKYSGAPMPKSLTTTIEAAGAGLKVASEGVAADGSHIAYGFTSALDGKESPMTGTGTPNGADTISLTKTGPNSLDATLKKGDKVVMKAKSVVSKDGKTRTITGTGTNAAGQPTKTTGVYDKQ
jgi:hypothetical protein